MSDTNNIYFEIKNNHNDDDPTYAIRPSKCPPDVYTIYNTCVCNNNKYIYIYIILLSN